MGGSSSSQANQSQTTNNTDERVVNESGIVIGKGANLQNVTVERIDGEIVNNAINEFGEGFSKLLTMADKMFTSGTGMIQAGQDSVLAAAQSVENDKRGAIDQKTMIILGVAAAAALVMVKRK
jgi:hypothetical protein